MYGECLRLRLTGEQAAKLRRLEATTKRTRSAIVRLLIDAAVSSGMPDLRLDAARLEGRDYGER
jgi:predicted DNA-binding protein